MVALDIEISLSLPSDLLEEILFYHAWVRLCGMRIAGCEERSGTLVKRGREVGRSEE